MQRDADIVLKEMLDAIDVAIEVCSNLSFEKFSRSRVERFAVQRAIEIISEATRHLPAAELEGLATVPWSRIKAMGNIPRHEYHRLDDEIVWDVVRHKLPDLRAIILAAKPHLDPGKGDA